ncbi:MAG: hypothetical protein Q9160_004425 [Pyrenula sp. 1 TL-2023]
MTKRTILTSITPLPPQIPRHLVIEYLHHHASMIELNPLVIKHELCKAPKNAPADEFHCLWYELTDRIQYLPGLGTLTSGQVKYSACFHDLPYGLQTHVYAPMGLDIKNKWTVRGNMPGEPREARELGIDAPRDGLYLREDVDMRCNRVMTGFVKKNLKSAHKVLVERLMAKAELAEDIQYSLDRGVNHPRSSLLSSEGSLGHGSQHGSQHGATMGSRYSQQAYPPVNLAPPPGQGPASPSLTSCNTAVSSPGFINPAGQFAHEYQKSISDLSSEPDKSQYQFQSPHPQQHPQQHLQHHQTSPGLYPPPLYQRISAGNASVPDEYRWQLQMQQFHNPQPLAHNPDGKQVFAAELPADQLQRQQQKRDEKGDMPRIEPLSLVNRKKVPSAEAGTGKDTQRHEMSA